MIKRHTLITGLISFGLLIFLILFISRFSVNALSGDEYRFFGYAEYMLLEGKYAMDSDGLLWNGPGLPLIMTPFVYLDIPILYIRFLNAFFLVAAFIILNQVFQIFLSKRIALAASLAMVIFPAVLKMTALFYTEILCFLLISLLIYFLVQLGGQRKNKIVFAAAACFAYLILTKIIFFFVLVLLLVTAVILKLIYKTPVFRSFLQVFGLSLVFILPYLLYTYQVTGKFPYLGNSGGMQLYWMTVDGKEHTGEWHPFPGDWNPYPSSSTHEWSTGSRADEVWYQENKAIIDEWKKLGPVAADQYLKQVAFQNILNQPSVLLKNLYYNTSRLILNVPRNKTRKAGKLSWFNFIFVFAFAFILFNTRKLLNPKKPVELFLFLLLSSYLFGSLLLSGYERFFIIVFPVIAYLCLSLLFVKKSITHPL